MKSTERFKETIKSFLDQKSQDDAAFNEHYNKENKKL